MCKRTRNMLLIGGLVLAIILSAGAAQQRQQGQQGQQGQQQQDQQQQQMSQQNGEQQPMGGNGEQRQRQQQVRGEITAMETKRMVIADIETQDGQMKQVILGTSDEVQRLGLQEGSQVTVQGSQTQISGEPFIAARQVQRAGRQQQQQQRQTSQRQQQQQQQFQPQLVEANNLVGMDVMGTNDESIGTLNELILDSNQNKIGYALLEATGDVEGVYLVSWDQFEVQGMNGEAEITLTTDQQQLQQMPSFESGAMEDISIDEIRNAIRQSGQQQGSMQRQQGRQQQMGQQQQQQGGQQQVQGEITSLQTQRVNNQRMMVADVETQDGQTMTVILGSSNQLQQLNLQEGSQISVTGSQTQFQGQQAIQAREVRSNNQRVRIQPQGQQQQMGQQRQQRSQQQQQGQYGQTLGESRRQQQGDTDYFILYDEGDAEVYRMDGQQRQQGQAEGFFKLTNVIGLPVEDQQQEEFGELENVIIDTREGRLVYGVVTYGGFLGIAEDMAAVPWASLQIDPQQNMISMNAQQDVLEQIAYQEGDLQRLEDPQYSRQIFEQFNEEPYWVVYGYAPPDGQQQQQQRGQQQVQGEIQSLQTQRVNNQRMMVAEVQTQDGQTQQVILGSPDQLQQLNLQEGDRINVTGSQTQFQGQQAIQASEVRANNQRVRIQQQGQQMGQQMGQQRGQQMQGRQQQVQAWQENSQYSQAFNPDQVQSYTGTIQSVGTFRPEQGAMEGLRLRVQLQDGQTRTVYAGPRAYARQQGINLRQGDSVQLKAADTNFNNRRVLIASEITKDNQRLELFDDQGKPAWDAQQLMQMQQRGMGNGEAQQQMGQMQQQGQQQQPGQQQQGQQQQSQQQQVQGEVTSLQMQRVNNQRMTVAEVKTQDGQTMKVILGSPDQLTQLNLKEGDQVSVQGSSTQLQGEQAVKASRIRANNQQIRIQQGSASGQMGGGSQGNQ